MTRKWTLSVFFGPIGVPMAGGNGTILFSQLDIQRHVDRSRPDYDPVAENILINLFQETPSQSRCSGRKGE